MIEISVEVSNLGNTFTLNPFSKQTNNMFLHEMRLKE